MPLYEFECRICGKRFTRIMHVSAYNEPACECGGGTDQVFDGGNGGWRHKQTFGKWTGMYDYDYGKKATWDLTPPGKHAELLEKGIIRDPFREHELQSQR